MSSTDQPAEPTNVVALRVVPPTAPTEPAETLDDRLYVNPSKQEMYEAIKLAMDFLFEHRNTLNYFVLATSDTRPDNVDDGAYHNIFTSRISKADFCLAVKLLDNAITENL